MGDRKREAAGLALAACAGAAAGALGGVSYAVPSAAPLMLAALFAAYLGIWRLLPSGPGRALAFSFGAGPVWIGFVLWAHRFVALDFPSIFVYGSMVASVLALVFVLLVRQGGLGSAFAGAAFFGGLDLAFNLLPMATSLSPPAQCWAWPGLIAACSLAGGSGWTMLAALVAGGLAVAAYPGSRHARVSGLALSGAALLPLAAAPFVPGAAGREIRVAAIQSGTAAPEFADLAGQTREAAQSGASLVVWQEQALWASPVDNPRLRADASGLARECGVALVVPFVNPVTDVNQLAVFGSGGELVGVTSKLKPAWVVGEQSVAGSEWTVHRAGFGQLGACICYDAYYPAIPGRLVASGASVLAVPALSMCPEGAVRYAPLVAVLRAVENGVPVIWAEPMASSLVADGKGRVLARAGFGRETAAACVRLNPRGTLHSRARGVIPIALLAATAIAAIVLRLRERHCRPKRDQTRAAGNRDPTTEGRADLRTAEPETDPR